ncbi:hypothetical protein ABEB36_004649 [Hypothenemus hampei]|uniref:Uncharacterized protein n=1 Tax=Hypothenemus hampei TaxID=57062 RepID=A0ABD1F4C5_HYPHA
MLIMDSDLSDLSDFEQPPPGLRRRSRRRRLVVQRNRFTRDGENLFETLDDIEFKRRFRLNKNTVTILLQQIGPALQPKTTTSTATKPFVRGSKF